MVGLLLVVLSSAAFMGGAFLSPGSKTSDRLIALFILVPLVVWAGLLTLGLRRALFGDTLTRRRWRRFEPDLRKRGLRDATAAEIVQTSRLPVHVLLPPVVAERRGGGIDHVLVGEIANQDIRCFNVRLRGGMWADTPVVAARMAASFAPCMIYRIKGFATPPRPNMKRVRFESGTFNRKIAVYSEDPFFASAMIDARMMEWLGAELRGTVVELSDRWAVAWALPRAGRRLRPQDLIDTLAQFDEHIPRAVPSLFPIRGQMLLWRTRRRERSMR
jgi:hypothetical protein